MTKQDIRRELQNKIGQFCWLQFKSMNAYTTMDCLTLETTEGQIVVQPIRSYNTVVGFADLTNKLIVEVGKYSRTTSKQFTQISNSIYSDYERIYCDR